MRNGIRFSLPEVGARAALVLLGLCLALTVGVGPAVGGDPVQIIRPGGFTIEAGTTPGDYAASAAGTIVYDDRAGAPNGGDFGPVWIVASGQAPVELDSGAYDFNVTISGDGSKVAFARLDPVTGASDIYAVNADGSDLHLVADGEGVNTLTYPKFSPDGGSIAYTCRIAQYGIGTGLGCGPTPEGTYFDNGVMLVNADGSDARMIVVDDGYDPVSWSPDGQSIAVVACQTVVTNLGWTCGPDQVFVYRTDGSDLFNASSPTDQVTNFTDPTSPILFPQFTPDGTQILFMKIVSNAWDLFSVNRDGSGVTKLSSGEGGQFEVVPPATGGAPSPTVSVVQPGGPGLGSIVVRSWLQACRGFIEVSSTGQLTACTPVPAGADAATYAPAADGSIVFNDGNQGTPENATEGPVWVSAPGQTPVEIDSSPLDFDPAISPDGTKVAFARWDPSMRSSDIYTANADGSDVTLVASSGGVSELTQPEFSPDGGSIAYDCSSLTVFEASENCGPLADGTSRSAGVMLMGADGSNKQMIVIGGHGSIAWSPDGASLAMADGGQVFVYHADGSDLFNWNDPSLRVTQEPEGVTASLPQFGPDGSQILFSRSQDETGTSGTFAYVINRDGTDEHQVQVTSDPEVCIDGICVALPTKWGLIMPPGSAPGPLVDATHVKVPKVRNLSLSAATKRLVAAHLSVRSVSRVFSANVPKNQVVATQPAAGALAHRTSRKGAPVTLVVSRGIPCAVPKLKGLTVKSARRAIWAGHCSIGTIRHSFARKVEKGHVIAQRQVPGQKLRKGAKVGFTVSQGRRPKT